MSLVKITELPTSTGFSATTDYLPIVHNGVTQKITPQSLYDVALTAPGPIGSVTPSTIDGTIITGSSITISSSATVTSLMTGASIQTGNGVTTGSAYLELGGLRTGDGASYIDFHSTSGSDYDARLIRHASTNGALELFNTGTGGIDIWTSVSAPILLKTASIERMRIDPTGNIGIGISSFTSKLSIQGTSATDAPTLGTEFLTGGSWTSTGWTGNNTTGWAHTSGTTTVSYSSLAVTATKYQIAYTVTRSAGSFTVAFGGQSNAGITATGTFGPTTTTTANLVITPTTDFVGSIIISIKAITAGSTALISAFDSTGTARFEVRASSGTGNTFLGKDSGKYNTTGIYNTSSGLSALQNNTTGNQNSGIGSSALYANTTGNFNSALGYQAGSFIANGSTVLTIVNNSTYIGSNTKASADSITNETVIGYNATGSGSNTVTLGGSAVTSTIIPYGNVGIGTSSPSSKLTIGRIDSASEGGQINLCKALDNGTAWSIDIYGSTSTPALRFVDATAGTERMRIDASGNVGIGNTPSGTYNLEVTGSISGTQLTSTIATSTAPFVVASTTNVVNLNASSLNGATFAAPGSIGSGTASAGAFTSLTATGAITSSGGGIGYATGNGVAVTQLTSRTTATPTTGAKLCGAITLFSVAPVVSTWFSFTVPNTAVAATDNVIVTVRSGTNTYIATVSAITAATSFQVSMVSIVGTAVDAPIVNFAIIKSVAA